MHSILIIDDNVTLKRSLELSLTEDGYEVTTAGTGEEGLAKVRNGLAELVFLDLKLPDMNGIKVLRQIKKINEDIIVVVITAYGDIKSAVEAMKLSAYDYVTKPFEIDQIKLIIKKSLENISLKTQIKQYKCRFDNIIGESSPMRSIYGIIEKIVQSNATTILIDGETGTGKGLLARTIHDNSSRRFKPFIDINCSSLSDNLIESELFGYEKGAFTDAKQLKKGLVEQADGGTLFIDEIGELQPSLQVKLLKVIDEKTFRRVGGVSDINVDIRIIAATNRDLKKLASDGRFRKDLFYRLKVVTIHAPALRERKGDIPQLVEYFIRKFSKEFKKKVKSVAPEAKEILVNQSWPGNVRELKNTIERICLLEDTEVITPEHLTAGSEEISSSRIMQTDSMTGMSLEEIERRYIKNTLKEANNNKSKAAEILGISRHTLRKKLDLE